MANVGVHSCIISTMANCKLLYSVHGLCAVALYELYFSFSHAKKLSVGRRGRHWLLLYSTAFRLVYAQVAVMSSTHARSRQWAWGQNYWLCGSSSMAIDPSG